MRISDFIFGGVSVSVPASFGALLLDAMMKESVDYGNLTGNEEKMSFDIAQKDRKRFEGLAKGLGAEYRITRLYGLYYVFRAYRKRAGILIGAILFLFLTQLSQNTLWSISVRGNSTLSEEEILGAINEKGCFVGAYIPSLELEQICNAVLLEQSSLSWMSINIIGNCAEVVVREHIAIPDSKENEPSDIIASSDGQIERIELYSGQCEVVVGQSVKKGDLLVGGRVSTGREGVIRLDRSSAKIWARTQHTLTVDIPRNYSEKEYTGREITNKSIIFFGKEIKISQKGGKEEMLCDTIIKKEQLVLFGRIALPVWSVETIFREYRVSERTRDNEELAERARNEGARLISERFANAELLSVYSEYTARQDGYRIVYQISCIEDIAITQPIGIISERDEGDGQ